MNPTRKERMDASSNLMEIPYTGNDSYTAWLYVADALNIDDENALLPDGWRLIVAEIARLIDPEPMKVCHVVTTERKVSQTQTMVSKSCSCCGYVFGSEEHRPLLPGLGNLEQKIVLGGVLIPNYCPFCGAKVVDE